METTAFTPKDCPIPALLPIIGTGHLVIQANGATLDRAHDTVQGLIFRLLAAIPPGKLRMTLVDAVGVGRSDLPPN